MLASLTRRALVGTASAAVVAAIPPSIGGAHADAALLALRPDWLKAHAAYEATFDPLAEAERLCRSRSLEDPGCDRSIIQDETGFTAARGSQQKAHDAEWEIIDRVFGQRAATREGVCFKLEIMKAMEGCDDGEWDASLQSDLLVMVGIADA